jgi:hypothetical protein
MIDEKGARPGRLEYPTIIDPKSVTTRKDMVRDTAVKHHTDQTATPEELDAWTERLAKESLLASDIGKTSLC